MNRIGGSARVRDNLAEALEVGRKVTAKVQWLSKTAPKSRPRWIHCTPLLGVNDTVGVWMVILVDDEDEIENEPGQQATKSWDTSRLGPSYTAEAIPWDAGKEKANAAGVSTKIWSEGNESKKRLDDTTKLNPRKPLFRLPTDTVEMAQAPSIIRPGPKIAGKAYSYTSSNDGQIAADETATVISDKSRPNSSSSSILTPIQTSMQPKVRLAGRASTDSGNPRRPPVNMPYRPSVDEKEDRAIPIRRTYKSLSPYGVLFED